jgi:hypothetical protein
MICRKCKKSAHEINGWLKRQNELGEKGIWECRPNCNAELTQDEALIGAIADDEENDK